jgi:hypothetical protein
MREEERLALGYVFVVIISLSPGQSGGWGASEQLGRVIR